MPAEATSGKVGPVADKALKPSKATEGELARTLYQLSPEVQEVKQ